MADRFRYYLRVRYSECDAQKVVFNARYGDYIGVAWGEFLRALVRGNGLLLDHFDYQLVKQTVEWKAPARFDQIIELAVAVKHLGNTSFTTSTTFRPAGDEKIIATAETVIVLLDALTMTKQAIPDDLRTALLKGAPGVVHDHAGYLRLA